MNEKIESYKKIKNFYQLIILQRKIYQLASIRPAFWQKNDSHYIMLFYIFSN